MSAFKSNETGLVMIPAPTISIVIPVYNADSYIKKCIASLVSQTFTDFEILIVDDGSTDESADIIRSEMQSDKRIVCISQENKGSGVARNTGIEKARGDYLCFVDADDHVHPQYLELMHQTITQESSCIASCRIQLIAEDGRVLQKSPTQPATLNWKEALKNILLVIDGGSSCNKMYKKSLLQLTMFPSGYYEDIEMIVRLFAVCQPEKISFVNQCLYYYSQRKGSKTHSINKRATDGAVEALETIEKVLLAQGLLDELKWEYVLLYIRRIGYTAKAIAIYSKTNTTDMDYLLSLVNKDIFNTYNIIVSMFRYINCASILRLFITMLLCFGPAGRKAYIVCFTIYSKISKNT